MPDHAHRRHPHGHPLAAVPERHHRRPHQLAPAGPPAPRPATGSAPPDAAAALYSGYVDDEHHHRAPTEAERGAIIDEIARIDKGAGHIRIDPTSDPSSGWGSNGDDSSSSELWRHEEEEQIRELMMTPSGRQAVMQLEQGRHDTTIRRNGVGVRTEGMMTTSPTDPDNARHRVQSPDAVIHVDRDVTDHTTEIAVQGPDGVTAEDYALHDELGHELIHAHHIDMGRSRSDATRGVSLA
jgi:hypothetical protein